jgi:hypothetical protein
MDPISDRGRLMNDQSVVSLARNLSATSSLVRRLVRAKLDPGKKRVRQLLNDIDDRRLLEFGLAPEDIALLRGVPVSRARNRRKGTFRP